MAEITIRLKQDPKTGVREVTIDYESDSDALPHEHEQDHKRWAQGLIGHPLGGSDVVTVNRVQKRVPVANEKTPDEPTQVREAARTSTK